MEVDPNDARIHTSYTWVSTFRLSSSESHFGGGGNLQNIPVRTDEGREIRRLFIPDPGLVFLAGDLAQTQGLLSTSKPQDSTHIGKGLKKSLESQTDWTMIEEDHALIKEDISRVVTWMKNNLSRFIAGLVKR
jgi:hypothetical protein